MSVVTTLAGSNSLFRNRNPPIISSTVDNDAYILSIVNQPRFSSYALSLALKTGSSVISLRDQATLREKKRWEAHRSVSQLKSNDLGHLISSGKDGLIHQWDDRSEEGAVLTLTAPNRRSLLCFDCSTNGYLIAAGSEYQNEEAPILFWDIRSPNKLARTHSSTHSDDITNLAFIYSSGSETLLSSATDGLLSLSNPFEDDEDEAVLNVSNWGTSISKLGLFRKSAHGQSIWTSSDMETFAIWNLELELIQEFGDVRSPRAMLPDSSRDWKIDYIVDILPSMQSPDVPLLIGGTNEGGIGLVEFTEGLTPVHNWRLNFIFTGHEGIVRSVVWDESKNLLITGGEDSKVNVWKIDSSKDAMDLDDIPFQRKRGFDGDMYLSHYKKTKF